MPTILSQLQAATATKRKQVVVFKQYDPNKVADAVKTLAREWGRPVHRVHLSALAGKYLSETEKNLQRVLEKVKGSEAILFFDEVDALFGKRTGIKNAHDRYANRETDYLLEKMKQHDGLVVVAYGKRNSDEGFIRRLQAIIQFQRAKKDE